MNIHTLIARLKNNEIKINKSGHQFNSQRLIDQLIDRLQFNIDYHTPKVDDEKHHAIMVRGMNSDDAYGPGLQYMDGFDGEVYCWCCGNRGLRFNFINDEDTLEVIQWKNRGTPDVCPIKDEPVRTTIEVPSGSLVFSNWFDVKSAPEGEEYGNDYCINALLGRINEAKYLAAQGYGYGQMGNMSVTIYVSKDRKSIKVIPGEVDYIYDEVDYQVEEGDGNEITK